MSELIIFSIMNLKQHRLRTILSTVSIIVATFLVSFTLVIGDAMHYTMKMGMKIVGMNDIIVDRYDWEKEKVSAHRLVNTRKPIGLEEYSALKNVIGVGYISRVTKISGKVEFKGNTIKNVDVLGVDPAYFGIRGYKVALGRGITYGDNLAHASVCVLGCEVAKKIKLNSLPAFVTVNNRIYRVIGILNRMGEVLENKPDEVVLIPFNTFYNGGNITLHIVPGLNANRDSLKNIIRSELLRVRGKYGENGKFGINDMEEVFKSFKGVSSGITKVIILFAVISLFVGGIGIANVMLTAARERIHEIGILKSLGLSNKEVFWMFIVESIILSLGGAVIGITSGYLLAYLALLTNSQGFILHFTVTPLIISLLMVLITGFLAGLYPATEASKREVIESLRYL